MNNLREVRKEKGLTVEKLAKMTGSAKSYISDLENNVIRDPSLGKARLIALALRVEVESIFPRGEANEH